MLTGENGILTQAQRAKTETENAQDYEENILAGYENYLNAVTGSNTEFEDGFGNKVVVPAGFEVVNPNDNVEDGIIIRDVTYENTKGSEFVWIPTGTIHTSKGDITINLDRYTFASNGNETRQGNNDIVEYSGEFCQELSTSTYGNTTAKDIEDFLEKADENGTGGYYIGRYESRNNNENVIVDANYSVYNDITQPQAASLSRSMYTNNNFTSDLVNSYAWDTALVFIQQCSEDKDYSQQNSLNSSYTTIGTTEDHLCNIYDMASNFYEWTTETAKTTTYQPCVGRGGNIGDSSFLASTRDGLYVAKSDDYSFRTIIYL